MNDSAAPLGAGELPDWLRPVALAAERIRPNQLSRFQPPERGGRASAVLMLFGEGEAGPDVLIIERAHGVRSHAGQPAFPGGAVDPEDASAVAAALREAEEETGLDPAGVRVFATLPVVFVPPSGFVVTPVLGWWRKPSPVAVVDEAEVASVHRIPLAELLDPANRLRVRHPSGHIGPAFRARGLLIWGFTAGLLSRLFHFSGMEVPWDSSKVEDLPTEAMMLAVRTYDRGQPPDAPA